MGDDRLVRVHRPAAAELDYLLLAQREQDGEEALVHLQDLDQVDEAPVRCVELAVEAVGLPSRLAVRARAQLGEIDGADEPAEVLGAGVGGDVRPDPD